MIQSGNRANASRSGRFLSLYSVDGRTRAAQRLHASISAIEADLGGRLAARERQMVRRAALAGMMAEDLGCRWLLGASIDLSLFAALANAERGLLESVAIKRPKHSKQRLPKAART
jgi:hypothetical protein